MNDNELKRMEQESAELLALLREVREEDNVSVHMAPCPRPNRKAGLRISPYWLVAASLLGFVLGMAIPRESSASAQEYTTLLADTSYTIGRSLAAGDINFALLVQ
jgi:hypothetical protein